MIDFFFAHIYIVLTIGMFIGGETFLLPAIYLAIKGDLSLWLVLFIAITTNLGSDIIWYYIGKYLPFSKLQRWEMIAKKQEFVEKTSKFFKHHALRLLFISKFVYGTRTISQVICGAHRIPFVKYVFVNFLGIIAYLGFILIIAYSIIQSLDSLKETIFGTQIAFAIFILIIVLFEVWIKRIFKKKFRL